MNVQSAIIVNNLYKLYKKSAIPAVNEINLEIPKKSVFGLLGPNGAGKTTTISMLCGLIKPSSGKITIEGFDIKNDLESIKQIIGVVPQDIALYPTLTAYENLKYIGNMYGLKGVVLTTKIHENLQIFGLDSVANKRLETFSGGMKRRINLIAGILHNPKILFLDEPTVGVDVQSRNVITEHLHQLNNNGMTIIYTSHLMEEAENLCTDIAIIDAGKIITQGKPKELIKQNNTENLEQLFLQLTGKKLRD
ncbi:MAG: ABC transporter ATP-binding protein [Bacteroidia bacterium]|nr:ABC transporter ATP-binding protein [Bacteroidia bacterium]